MKAKVERGSDYAPDDNRKRASRPTSSSDPGELGSHYIALLASEPPVAMSHVELRAALRGLPEPGPTTGPDGAGPATFASRRICGWNASETTKGEAR